MPRSPRPAGSIGAEKTTDSTVIKDDKDHWHLDRRVPIAILVIVGIQTAGFLTAAGWYIGKDQEWKTGVEQRLSEIPTVIPPEQVIRRLTAVETNQMHIMATLRAIAERLNVTPPPPQ